MQQSRFSQPGLLEQGSNALKPGVMGSQEGLFLAILGKGQLLVPILPATESEAGEAKATAALPITCSRLCAFASWCHWQTPRLASQQLQPRTGASSWHSKSWYGRLVPCHKGPNLGRPEEYHHR